MLTDKQNRFIEAYMVSGRGAQAAIQAGYSPRTARSIACENLQKPEIAAEIKRRSATLTRHRQAEADRVVTKLKNIAFANIHDVLNPDGSLKDLADWPEGARDAFQVRKIKRKSKGGKNGTSKDVGYVLKITLKNKLKALDLLAKHLGLLPRGRRSSKNQDSDGHHTRVHVMIPSRPKSGETSDR